MTEIEMTELFFKIACAYCIVGIAAIVILLAIIMLIVFNKMK